MDLGISGRTALVLAASKGLGFGVARALKREGVNTFICGRNPETLKTAIMALEREGSSRISGAICDVSDRSQLHQLLQQCRDTFGPPDILIYNNGGPPAGDPNEFSEDDFTRAFQTGFLPAVHIIRSTSPDMVQNGWGRILILSSISVRQPLDSLILSSTMRSALQSYLKTISRQFSGTGVTINAILPGPHDTDRMKELYRNLSDRKGISLSEAQAQFLHDIPMKRAGTIEEFGALAAFLCSRQAAYITGQAIPHDGGALRSTW
ncbi:MAG: SDR family oxidoreductase [Fidelibacterota bacterium]